MSSAHSSGSERRLLVRQINVILVHPYAWVYPYICTSMPPQPFIPAGLSSMASDTPAADDLVSVAGTHGALQAKADIVSAFCLIFGLEVAVQKNLRCFHLKWNADDLMVSDNIVIHLVPFQTDGLMKHLLC